MERINNFFVQDDKVFTLPVRSNVNKLLNEFDIEEETVIFSEVTSECWKATRYLIKTRELQKVYDGFSEVFATREEAEAALIAHNEEVVRNLKAAEELAKKGML